MTYPRAFILITLLAILGALLLSGCAALDLIPTPQPETPKRIWLYGNPDYPRIHENLCKYKQTSHGLTARFPSAAADALGMSNDDPKDTVCIIAPKHVVDGKVYVLPTEATVLTFYKLDLEIVDGVKERNPSYRNTADGVDISNQPKNAAVVMTTNRELKSTEDATALQHFSPADSTRYWEGYLNTP